MTNANEQQQAPASHLSLLAEATSRSAAAAAAGAASASGPSPAAAFHDRSLAESMLRRGLGDQGNGAGGGGGAGAGGPLREELLRQKQADSMRQAAALHAQQSNNGAGLLQQLSESQQLSQQISQQLSHSDIRSALASAQLRQAPQLSNSDIMALARTGALPGLGGIIGAGGLAGMSGGAGQRLGELELQSLEELERRQRRLASGLPPQVGGAGSLAAHVQAQNQAAQQESESAASANQSTNAANGQKASLMGGPMGVPQSDFAGEADPRASAPGDKESRRDPGSVVVPCRARGMPMDHNFKTAYFVIPENVRHGEELICSYFACRNAGVKFRYCSHCKVPVAKRNFRKRHRHGDTDKSKAIVDDDDNSVEGSVEENNDGELDDVPPKIKAKEAGNMNLIANMQDINRASAGLGSQALNGHQQRALDQLNAQQQMRDAQAVAQHAAAQDARALQERSLMMGMPNFASQASKLQNAIKDGANLPDALAQRFGGAAQAFASGLPGSVSLGATNLSAFNPAGNGGAQGQGARSKEREMFMEAQKEKWLALLASRPLTTDGDTMSAWLMEVLAVSDPSLLLGNRNIPGLGMTTMTAGEPDDKTQTKNDLGMDSVSARMMGMTNEEALKALETKRALAQAGLGAANDAGCNVSFTEWRDRKKQKKGMPKR
ncbi:expressed unknown protein [Seminavis robusta]|uniref:Uncharacterized protein n=1 Tax=Seminavis robusta TaxID=568900 RepID=A0A9N8DIV0_9STRA|nr:expressed unknown protein [Seminavis robusta]|eukprot:Sro182_g079240.1 n/a (665) ;mRNA; r:10496-12595